MKHHLLAGAALLLAGLLAGCATVGGPNMTGDAGKPSSTSELPKRWQLAGKMASSGLGAANFTWQQQGSDIEIAIHAPLGMGAARLAVKSGKFYVETSEGVYQDREAREWMRHYDLEVPYQAMPYWMQGLAYPRLAVSRVDEKSFQQAGWIITVKRKSSVNCVTLPERLMIQNGEIRLKFGGMRWDWQNQQSSVPKLFAQPKTAQDCVDG